MTRRVSLNNSRKQHLGQKKSAKPSDRTNKKGTEKKKSSKTVEKTNKTKRNETGSHNRPEKGFQPTCAPFESAAALVAGGLPCYPS